LLLVLLENARNVLKGRKGLCRKGFKNAGKVLLSCGKGFAGKKKWERFQNSRKGYTMTISKLEMERKGKGNESFQSLPLIER
jgi:hypothetical protein